MLSARSEPALSALRRRYEELLAASGPEAAGDICYSAAVCRSQLTYRFAVTGNYEEILAGLRGVPPR